VSNIAKDAIHGENIKDAAIKNIKTGAQQLLDQAAPQAFTGLITKSAEPSIEKSVTSQPARVKLRKRKLPLKGSGCSTNFKKKKKDQYPALSLLS
jgi:hypothetical protein